MEFKERFKGAEINSKDGAETQCEQPSMHPQPGQSQSAQHRPLKECHRGSAKPRHCTLCLALEAPEENTLIWKADDKTRWTSFIHCLWPVCAMVSGLPCWPQIVWPGCFLRLTRGYFGFWWHFENTWWGFFFKVRKPVKVQLLKPCYCFLW